MQSAISTGKGWHTANWGTLGWLETILKVIGVVIGWVAFASSNPASALTFRSNPHFPAIVLLALLTIGALVMLQMRVRQQEVVSVVFALLNLSGFVTLLLALMRDSNAVQGLAIAFAALYAVGEVVKQLFLRTSGYTEGGMTNHMIVNFSRGLMGTYLVLIVLLVR